MRTTLTLDPDVVRMLEDEVHRQRLPLKTVVNQALRRGLAPQIRGAPARPYRVRPHAARLLAGIDRGRLNALVEQLEDRAVLAKRHRRR